MNRNISAVVIYFWNAGNMPIHSTEILEKDRTIHCVFTDDVQILKSVVLRTTRDIINFRTNLSNTNPHIFDITFDILEHNDGGAIQIIYAGPLDAEPQFTGTIEGAGGIKIRKAAYGNLNEVPPEEIPWWLLIAVIVSVVAGVLLLFLLPRTPTNTLPGRAAGFIMLILAAILLSGPVQIYFVLPKYLGLNNVPQKIAPTATTREGASGRSSPH